MKKPYLLLINLLLGTLTFGQTTSDIYNQILTDFIFKISRVDTDNIDRKTIILVENYEHSFDLKPKYFERLKSKYKRLELSTFTNFTNSTKKEIEIKNDEFYNAKIIVVKNNKELDSVRQSVLIPDLDIYTHELSNVGLNDKKTQAIIYYSFSAPGVGGGLYLIYKKTKRKWKLKKTIPVWAS